MRRWAEIKFLTAAIWLNRRHAWSQFHKWDHEQEFYVKRSSSRRQHGSRTGALRRSIQAVMQSEGEMKVITETQGTAAWLAARCGRITASRMADVMNFLKPTKEELISGARREGADRRKYRIELVTERLTGIANSHYVSKDMEMGTYLEPIARAEYEDRTGSTVDLIGFVEHPDLPYSGASPDGILTPRKGTEFKCPRSTTHVRWRLEGVVPEEHKDQMLWTMDCCELEELDFVSYSDGKVRDWEGKVIGGDMPEELKLFIVPFKRDEERIAEMRQYAYRFEMEIQSALEKVGVSPNYWAREAAAPPPSIYEAEGMLDDTDLDRIIKL